MSASNEKTIFTITVFTDTYQVGEKDGDAPERLRFEKLSDQVLVDVVAALPLALPLAQLRRMRRLGSARLAEVCARKWVALRCSRANATDIVLAALEGGSTKKNVLL